MKMLDRSDRFIYRILTIKHFPEQRGCSMNMHDTPLPHDEATARMCKALGHPARFSILRQLLREDRCICGRIVEILPLAQSTVSQHLKVLKEAGLIRGEVEGPRTCYCVDKEQLAALAAAFSSLLPEPPMEAI
jgi:ArsR family transcriptional regulator